MPRVLVTGGAGYIGSHIVRHLVESGHRPIVLDSLEHGHRRAIGDVAIHEGDFAHEGLLDVCFREHGCEYVVHMAAYCEVGESMEAPAKYYENNVRKSLVLLEAARRAGVKGVVFSSTAAVYGEPRELPIPESHPREPTNPYGETKLAIENALRWYHGAYGLRYAALRYFNAAGAHPSAEIGEDHEPESHLIPRLLLGVASGGVTVPVFGDDYPTPDGTCVRDYVHVSDLASAHVLALEAMEDGRLSGDAFNLGNGEGFSVLDVVEAVGRATGERPGTRRAPRRAGDPATLVASSRRARETLGWAPAHPDIDDIVATAWAWHRTHPRGYRSA